MDVVLFHPAPRSGWQLQRRIELPLGLLCSATPLDRAGFRVRIIEGFGNRRWRTELRQALEPRPLCFGVTSMTGPQILHALEACRIVRQRHPDLPIIWGGVHASLLPEQTLAHPLADVVVVGEGEETLLELVRAIQSRSPLNAVRGIAYKEGGEVRRTLPRPYVDLDSQPPLSYGLVNVDHYRRPLFGLDHLSFNSSRGCPHRCRFCWDPVLHARTWRAMRPETVIEQLRQIVADHNIRGFLFTDDNFFGDRRRAREILERVVASGLALSISKLQVRADTICRMDEEFFHLLVRAGVKRLTIGVESGSPRLLGELAKDITVEQVVQANRRLANYPIVPLFLFMMALPTETPDELAQSIALASRLTEENPRASKTFNIYTPYPGTELFDRTVALGFRPPQRLQDWATFNFRSLPANAPWVSPPLRRLVAGLDMPLMLLGKVQVASPYKKTNRLAMALARLYRPLARYRVKNLDVRWPIETRLAKVLGLFARQD